MELGAGPCILQFHYDRYYQSSKIFIISSSIPTIHSELVNLNQSLIIPLFKGLKNEIKLVDCDLIIFGFCEPHSVPPFVFDNSKYSFLTYGLLNVLIIVIKEDAKKQIWQWIESNEKITATKYTIVNNEVKSTDFSKSTQKELVNPKPILNVSNNLQLIELANTRSNIINSAAIYSNTSISQIIEIVKSFGELDFKEKSYNYITALNSSFRSLYIQTLSNSNPNLPSLFYHGLHSVFGLGLIICGLNNLRNYIDRRIYKINFIKSVENMLQNTKADLFFLEMPADSKFWNSDLIKNHYVPIEDGNEAIIFSFAHIRSRENFKNLYDIISVPQECIYQSNTQFYNLYTITHELSHTIIQGILSLVYPSQVDNTDLSITKDLCNAKSYIPMNSLLNLRKTLIDIMQELNHLDGRILTIKKKGITEVEICQLLDAYTKELEELLVHLFDFNYFYNQDIDYYMTSIWLSWSTIPTINLRIEEYVYRSIFTIYSKHLTRGSISLEMAINDVLRNLESIQKHCPETVKKAIEFIQSNFITSTNSNRIKLYKRIVKIFIGLFYSEWAVSELVKDNFDNKAHLKVKELGRFPFENPLKFIKEYSKDNKFDVSKSYWIFYNLCFNYEMGN